MSGRSLGLDVIYLLVLIIISPFLLIFFVIRPDFRWYLTRKFCYFRYTFAQHARSISDSPVILIHGASLGEAMLAIKLAKLYSQKEAACFVFLTNTKSGFEFLMANSAIFKESLVLAMPFDFSFFISNYFSKFNIKMAIILESDYWPNFLRYLKRQGVFLYAVNARVSARTFKLYKLLYFFVGSVLREIDKFYYTATTTAKNLLQLGVSASDLIKTASFKINLFPPFPDAAIASERQAVLEDSSDNKSFLFVVGSLQPAEVPFILSAWLSFYQLAPLAKMVIIPRHPKKLQQFLRLFADQKLTLLKYKADRDCHTFLESVIFLNQLGILRKWYQMASCVFVGGSLCLRGGQNFLEPVALKKYTAVGPYVANFEAEKELLLQNNALIIVRTPQDLVNFLKKACFEQTDISAFGLRGYQAIKNNANSLNLVVDSILQQTR